MEGLQDGFNVSILYYAIVEQPFVLTQESLFGRLAMALPRHAVCNVMGLAEHWIRFGLGLHHHTLRREMFAREVVIRGLIDLLDSRRTLGAPDSAQALQLFDAVEAATRYYCAYLVEHAPDVATLVHRAFHNREIPAVGRPDDAHYRSVDNYAYRNEFLSRLGLLTAPVGVDALSSRTQVQRVHRSTRGGRVSTLVGHPSRMLTTAVYTLYARPARLFRVGRFERLRPVPGRRRDVPGNAPRTRGIDDARGGFLRDPFGARSGFRLIRRDELFCACRAVVGYVGRKPNLVVGVVLSVTRQYAQEKRGHSAS